MIYIFHIYIVIIFSFIDSFANSVGVPHLAYDAESGVR